MHLGLEETGRITTNTVPLKKAGEILFEIAFVLKNGPAKPRAVIPILSHFWGTLGYSYNSCYHSYKCRYTHGGEACERFK